MRRSKVSFYFKNYEKIVPNEEFLKDELSNMGYIGYIPTIFLNDLLVVSRHSLLGIEIYIKNDYIQALVKLIGNNHLKFWIKDTLNIFKAIASKYNLRVLESCAVNNSSIDFNDIPFSFNYTFDIKDIHTEIISFLKISEKEVNEIEELDEDVIKILSVANGIGDLFLESSSPIKKVFSMNSYSDIIKIPKYKFSDPLFNYKLSTKGYDILEDDEIIHKSNSIVLGYYLYTFVKYFSVSLIMRLFGVIALNQAIKIKNFKLIVYSFYDLSYDKTIITTIQGIKNYFSKNYQLKLYPIDNTKALNLMMEENKNKNIIFLPYINFDCKVRSNTTDGSINIISSKVSKYNTEYSNICKKTKGKFIII